MLNTPYTRWTGDALHGRRPVLTPAWVRLDEVFPRRAEDPVVVVPEGVETTGAVRAFVSGWVRASTGAWLAVVTYRIGYADGREGVVLNDQLVPGRVVRRRDDDRGL